MTNTSIHPALVLVTLAALMTIMAMTHTSVPEALSTAFAVLSTGIAARLTPSPTK